MTQSDITGMKSSFSKEIYERSRMKTFASFEDAYQDWLEYGRGEGLSFNEGKDTYLKIILKVKDEPELIGKWVEYHAAIAGYHNLIIMDCGSTDTQFLKLLEGYKSKLMVLKYHGYYDTLHSTEVNASFFEALAKMCKYITILDADEFLFGYFCGTLSPNNVQYVLRFGGEKIYAGTWFFNSSELPERDGALDWSRPIQFTLEETAFEWGTVGGKSIMRASLASQAKFVGHNLCCKEIIPLFTPASFGKIGVFHLNRLSPRLQKARVLKHLHAKGILPAGLVDEAEIERVLADILAKHGLPEGDRLYVEKYLNPPKPFVPARHFTADILAGNAEVRDENFARAVAEFDFGKLLNSYAARFGLPAIA